MVEEGTEPFIVSFYTIYSMPMVLPMSVCFSELFFPFMKWLAKSFRFATLNWHSNYLFYPFNSFLSSFAVLISTIENDYLDFIA